MYSLMVICQWGAFDDPSGQVLLLSSSSSWFWRTDVNWVAIVVSGQDRFQKAVIVLTVAVPCLHIVMSHKVVLTMVGH